MNPQHPSESWMNYGLWSEFCQSNPTFSSIDYNKITLVVSNVREGIAYDVMPDKFVCGGMDIIFEVVFKDSTIWLCQVSYVGKKYSSAFTEAMIHTTVIAMHYVALKSAICVSKVFSYLVTMSHNEIGAAYMFIEPIQGMSEKNI